MKAMRLCVVALAVAAIAAGAGCGPAPGSEARVPAGGVRVVPAEQVKGTCHCDDDEYGAEEATSPRPSTTYVKLEEWQPSPQVVEVEASVPPRGNEPPQVTTFPALTRHAPIGETSFRPVRGRVRR